jgi:site-specific DNA recombinase
MIHTMLLNPAYAGCAVYGRRRCVPWQAPLHPPRGHDGLPRRPYRQVPAPAEQHIGVPVPAIIDDALFAGAAEQLEENRKRSRERLAGVRHLLRGLLVCEKCGYGFTGHHHRGQWRYYRCCGTDRSRFHGQFRCDARLVAVEPLDAAVWDEVCRLLRDPARVLEEYQRRLDALHANPRRLELAAVERQSGKLRCAIDRLIDGFAEGLIAKHEFEPRIGELRRRAARLEAEAEALRGAEEQARSLQLVIGRLSVFAEMVRDRLESADWSARRDIICTLVKRIEVADGVVRVVFRVEPGSSDPPRPHRSLPHCLAGRRPAPHVARRRGLPPDQGRLIQRGSPARRRPAVPPGREGEVPAGTAGRARPGKLQRRRHRRPRGSDGSARPLWSQHGGGPRADPGEKRELRRILHPLRGATANEQLRHAPRIEETFPRAASARIRSSSVRSATALRGRASSASSAFSRFTWSAFRPPNSRRQR